MAKRGQALRRSRAAKRPAKPAVNPKEEIAALKRELAQALNQQAAATHDLQVSLEYQTATSDVLRVISHSTFDLQRILDTLVATAVRLCRADLASINIRDGEVYRVVASFDYSPELLAYARNFPMAPGRGTVTGRAALERQVVHVADLAADPEYNAPAWITFGKVRTGLGVPLLREGEPIGVIFLARRRMEPFAEGQIALVRTFADQAVIAIENTRLLTEQRQSLEQQTATAEVLQVINSSPGDLAPVFDAMLEKAMGLCEAAFGVLWTYDGAVMHPAAHQGVPPALTKFLTQGPYPVGEINAHARLLRGEPVVHIADVADTETYRSGDPVRRALVELGGGRTMLAVPLRKEKTFLGDFVIYRQEVKPFSEKQIALLENFAAQAVIAMENARLITETREALERQTATAEVLQVINSSPGDLAPVFDAILEKAHNLCAVAHGSLQLYDGERFRAVAVHGLSEAFADRLRQGWIPSPNHPGQQLLKGVRFVHVPELAEIGDPMARAAAELSGLRTALFIPLRKDATLLGEIVAARREVRPFSDKEIALLESFAAQAVIAMENARLITETREALEQQTATAEVLQVINSSPGDLAPVFDAMLEKAMRLCQAAFGIMRTFDGTSFQLAAERGVPEAFLEFNK